ncbi:response regulator transcription factor [Sphingomonas immobilis]|uniref:Response regulator transcription factor n=1 Tax=Sphingomonas immobilis TaxID=3063997 RepID=A0ABT8ZX50_9SPHN|nr:response regulator transcription factor [Sphingomonas sp. CA1-15]MDO7841863.1 response regulator transcription factor [Sphingomonas sp. CA1-15]
MRILLAEDDNGTALPVTRALTKLGHEVIRVTSGSDALSHGKNSDIDVVVLDRMLPGIDGIDVLRGWRAASIHTPVILLTALGGIADRVAGLDAGADDYLVKPFSVTELVARLSAIRRRWTLGRALTRFEAGDVVIDVLTRETRRAGSLVHLQPREFSLLEVLMRNAGSCVTRAMFLEVVWGFHFDPRTNLVETHLSRLRTKLKAVAPGDPIETVRGAGYRMRVHE